MVKPMTPSEQLVGRRLPSPASYMDTYLAGYVKNAETQEFSNRFAPSDSWMRPSHTKARKSGFIKALDKWSIMGSKPEYMWTLTDKGKEAALEAYVRYHKAEEARKQWGADCAQAFKDLKREKTREISDPEESETTSPKP